MRIAAEQPYTILYFTRRLEGVHERLRNVNPDARGDWVGIRDWWILPSQRRQAAGHVETDAVDRHIHTPGVQVGRIQNFNNWSPEMVPNPEQTALGLEYFCTVGDDLWNIPDAELIDLGKKEVAALGLVDQGGAVLGPSRVIRHLVDTARTFIFERGENGERITRSFFLGHDTSSCCYARPRSPSSPPPMQR